MENQEQSVNSGEASSYKLHNFNQTAYRILLLLQWLHEKPLTFAEINERFKNHPLIGKLVSQDTFWLYINTLKALGCEISRPTPSNQFCYKLGFHPFNYFLAPQDIDFIKEILLNLSDHVDYWTVVHFIQWMKQVFEQAGNKNRQELAARFFEELRIPSVDDIVALSRQLETYCQDNQVILVDYNSPTRGKSQITLLPHRLFHNQCTFYVLGHSLHKEKASMLRLDKTEGVTPVEDPETRRLLLEKQHQKQTYLLRILNCPARQYEPLGEGDKVVADPVAQEHLLVQFRTDNEFLLKQKLLASGYRFRVLYPARFGEEMQRTLRDMRQLSLT